MEIDGNLASHTVSLYCDNDSKSDYIEMVKFKEIVGNDKWCSGTKGVECIAEVMNNKRRDGPNSGGCSSKTHERPEKRR